MQIRGAYSWIFCVQFLLREVKRLRYYVASCYTPFFRQICNHLLVEIEGVVNR